MLGVIEGFSTIAAVIGLGWLLAQLKIVDTSAQLLLTKLAFFAASPALMVTVLSKADVAEVLSKNLIASVAGIAASGCVYLLASRIWWPKPVAETTVGLMSAVWVNAANLGIPIATYVLGDAALIVPMLLTQMLVMQPIALAVLDRSTSVIGTNKAAVWLNPLTVGSLIGLALAVWSIEIPRLIAEPLGLVAGMAVPAMLIAYGISLRLSPPSSGGGSRVEVSFISFLKLVLQPLVAFAVARYALGLDGNELLAVTVIAALPTAQNIFVHASRYARGVVLSRDVIFVTTMASAPVVFVIAALLA